MLLVKSSLDQGGDGMRNERRRRGGIIPDINVNTLSVIVYASLLFCAYVVLRGMNMAQDGVDCASIVDSALRVFGTELGICGGITIYKRWVELQDRRAQERKERRQEEVKRNE